MQPLETSEVSTPEAKRRPMRYGMMLAAVAVATALRWAIYQLMGDRMPFATYFPAVLISTLYGGVGPGLAAMALSGLAASLFLSPADGAGWGRQQWVFQAVFFAVNLVNVWMCLAVRRARSRAEMAVAARRRADRALSESEARFRVMADSAPVLIWIADAENRSVWFNQLWLDFTGRTMEQELGDGWMQGLHPDDYGRVKTADADAFHARRAYAIDYRLRRGDGEYRWMLEQGVPVFSDGAFTGYIGSCVDITDRKKVEQDRQGVLEREQAARQEAERTSRIKDEFLATLSHELRTPLNAILGWSQIIRPEHTPPQDVAEGLAIIERNARMQTQIISDLLDMSRIISGKIHLDMQVIDLSAVINAATESVQPSADLKGISITKVLDPAVPRIHGDPSRLQQAVWNLLTNAIKFTPRGGRVQLSLAKADSQVKIVVSDSGQGITPEFLPHLFERFRQADASSTRSHGGLGIGLSIVKSLIDLHGGAVTASSAGAGQGATFTIALPIPDAKARPDGQAPRDRPTDHPPAGTHLHGLRVLVVDDEPDSRELVARLLREHGALVTTAGDGAAALELLLGGQIDMLISDIGMPVMDGYELIRQARGKGVTVPAMALTAFVRSEDRTRAMLAGYQSHVSKPVEVGELIATVASLAGRTGMEDPPSPPKDGG